MGKIKESIRKINQKRKEFVERTRKKRPVGVKLTKYGRVFKVKKYS